MPPNVDTEPDPVRERLYQLGFGPDAREWLVETADVDTASLLNLGEDRLRGFLNRATDGVDGDPSPGESESNIAAKAIAVAVLVLGAAVLLGGDN